MTAGSDGAIRVWTKDEKRFAAPDVREVSQIHIDTIYGTLAEC